MCNQLCASFLSKANKCTLAEWLVLPCLIPDLELFKLYLFASLTFPLSWQWKYEHWLLSLFVPPSSFCAYGTGSSSRKYLTGPAVCKAVPCVSDKRQSLYGMRLCIFLSEEGFCLKRLRALSIKTFLNPAITLTMLDYIGFYQLQCHLDSLTNMV